MQSGFKSTISKEEVQELPLGTFQGEIVVVKDHQALISACGYLSKQRIIGFDTETRPSFTKGTSNKVALLQLSTDKLAFLFRIDRISMEKPLLDLLESQNIIKVGVSVTDDVKGLRSRVPFKPRGFVELQKFSSDFGIEDNSLRKLAAIVLGIKISKAQRLSNWEATTLTPPQQLYAATDAWVGHAIYVKLLESKNL